MLDNASSVSGRSPFFFYFGLITFYFNRLDQFRKCSMSSDGKKITGVKALNINEESAEAIEKMVDKAIHEIRGQGLEILEIQTSSDYLIMILGKS